MTFIFYIFFNDLAVRFEQFALQWSDVRPAPVVDTQASCVLVCVVGCEPAGFFFIDRPSSGAEKEWRKL